MAKNKGGRPSLYNKVVKPRLKEIEEWARSGATDKEIAAALGIAAFTFGKYRKQYDELSKTVDEAKRSGVAAVKNALLKRALGYEYEEKKTYIKRDQDGNTYQYTEATTKHVSPDNNAIGMYLRNFAEDWSDSDHMSNELKKAELELRKKIHEDNSW